MKLLFVRHGETDWNVEKKIQGGTDTELNETGIEQARKLGQKLAKQKLAIAKIYSSKLKRAYKTAQIVGQIVGVEVESAEGLEEMNLGQWEGMRWREVREVYSAEYEEWHRNRRYQRTPYGESYQELLERLLPALEKIIQKEKGTVLVVTHSADIVTLLAIIHQTPFDQMFQVYKVGNADVVEIDSKEILKIQLQEEKIVYQNQEVVID